MRCRFVVKRRAQKLKVFRTPIGFHDAYVAAPSQKAALEAWGAESNLFAQGIAEKVDDEKLVKAALDQPGKVIRVARGSVSKHLEAIGTSPSKKERAESRSESRIQRKRKPSRGALIMAEEAREAVETRYRAELREIADAQQALDRKRLAVERRHEAERSDALAAFDAAQQAYERALRAWKEA